MAEPPIGVKIVPAIAARFPDVAEILRPRRRDAPACWCLTYRLTSVEFGKLKGEARPAALRALCERDDAPGVIAYVDGVPAGWCAFGPRSEMGRLQRSRTIPPVDDRPAWSVVCFVVRAPFRRQGLAHRLLESAVSYARSRGVELLEAYPVEAHGTRISSSFAYVGTTALFESAGFSKVVETTARSGGLLRWVMRKELTD